MQEKGTEAPKKLNLNSKQINIRGAGIAFPKADPGWDQVAATATPEVPYRTNYSVSAATSTSYSPADVLRKT
jgi:hypothetical protein